MVGVEVRGQLCETFHTNYLTSPGHNILILTLKVTGSFFKSITREELLLHYVSRFTNTLIGFSRENSGFESHSSATDLPPWGAVP